MNLSIVPAKKIQKDPRNFAYLYPSMPLYKYKDAVQDWYRLKCIKALEEVAAMQDKFVVPAECIHWHRKKRFGSKRVELFGRSYYILAEIEMTENEKTKYLEQLHDQESED